jgi:hypothetical protein
MMKWSIWFTLSIACTGSIAQACFKTSVISPSPFLGNHGEIFKVANGSVYEVVGSYEYLYAYSPQVVICPGQGKMLVEEKTIGVHPIKVTGIKAKTDTSPPQKGKKREAIQSSSDAEIQVVLRARGCDYFIAEAPQGYLLLEWYGGHDPDKGDGILGEIRGYGFKDVLYAGGQEGRVYVDDYMLSKERALEKFSDKCN